MHSHASPPTWENPNSKTERQQGQRTKLRVDSRTESGFNFRSLAASTIDKLALEPRTFGI